MSDSKISQLPGASLPPSASDLLAIVQGTSPSTLVTNQITFEQLQTGITAGLSLIPAGGTTNQVLFKQSNINGDVGWTSFSNGITYNNGFQLGGSLGQNTSIDTGGNNISFAGSGNFGIGTTTPQFTLDVAGTNSAFNSAQSGNLRGNWTTTQSLPLVTVFGSSVISNGYIYLIGGYSPDGGTLSSTVYYSKINSDGSLAGWLTTTALPTGKGGQTVSVGNGYIYVTGGRDQTTYYARINSDGTIGNWLTGTSYPIQSEYLRSVVCNNYLYVIGGLHSSNQYVTNIYYAKLNADGSIGAWNTATQLPNGRQSPSVAIANGNMYIIGGYGVDNNTSPFARNTVYYAPINLDGSIGSWTTTTNLLYAIADHSSVVANGGIYIISGSTDSGSFTTPNVLFGKINSDGSLTWSSVSSTAPSIMGHASVYFNGYIYTIGGQSNTILSTVHYIQAPKVEICGAIDMLSLATSNSTMACGDAGSAIYAGNIYSNNNLEVAGRTQLFGGASVNGPFSLQGDMDINGVVSFKSISAPNISSAGAAKMYMDSTDNSVKISSNGGSFKSVVLASSNTPVTSGAPFTNNGYITVNIAGTDIKLMTTA